MGYALQPTRFLSHLLKAESGWTVSLEVFDDVGSEDLQGRRIAEQTKSTHDNNPLADRSRDLWKTFSNWIDEVNILQPSNTTFVMYVSQPQHSDIASMFSKASSLEDSRAALEYAKRRLLGDSLNMQNISSLSASIRPYVERVFSTDSDIVCMIILNFHIEFGSGSPQNDLFAQFRKLAISDEIVEDVMLHMQGWIKNITDRQLEAGEPAHIAYDAFHKALISYVRKRDSWRILYSFASDPTDDQISEDMSMHTYVRQLDIINVSDEDKVHAVIDFLKASIDRTIWSNEGLVDSSSFDDFEHSLVRTWRNCRNQVDIANSQMPADMKGKLLYYKSMEYKHMLEGREVPDHFTPGSFQALADTEEIGWHPCYKDLLHGENS